MVFAGTARRADAKMSYGLTARVAIVFEQMAVDGLEMSRNLPGLDSSSMTLLGTVDGNCGTRISAPAELNSARSLAPLGPLFVLSKQLGAPDNAPVSP